MPTPALQISYSLSNIENAVHQFWQYAHRYHILAFHGEMGAGKTTFIHYLCDFLKVEDTVSSPTFALVNEYHFDDHGQDRIIYHMDWYRMKDEEEAINSGLEDCLQQKEHYSFIEWPEKALNIIPKPYLSVAITATGRDSRTITANVVA